MRWLGRWLRLPPGGAFTGNASFRGDLSVRIIRAHPTLRQRFFDWLRSLRHL